MSNNAPFAYTIARVAELLAVSQDVVRQHIASGRLRAFDAGCGHGKKRWRVRAVDLDVFVRSRANMTDPESASRPRRRKQVPQTVTQYY
jgi:excisionase family DNA binding protein